MTEMEMEAMESICWLSWIGSHRELGNLMLFQRSVRAIHVAGVRWLGDMVAER